jgi:hypothetical protein
MKAIRMGIMIFPITIESGRISATSYQSLPVRANESERVFLKILI